MYEVAPILQRCKIFHVPAISSSLIEGTNGEGRAPRRKRPPLPPRGDSLSYVSLTGYEIVKLVKGLPRLLKMALSALRELYVGVIAERRPPPQKYIFTGTSSNQAGGVPDCQ